MRTESRKRVSFPDREYATIDQRRMYILRIILLLLIIGVAARTIYVQSAQNRMLVDRANSQQLNTQQLPAVRGAILDRNGRELAIGEEAVTFFGTPSQIEDPVGTALQVSKALGMKKKAEEDLIQRLTNAEGGFVYIARQIPRAKAEKLQDLKLPGVGWYDEERRWYPNGDVAGQILGAVNIDNVGIEGIEAMYDRSLTGEPGEQLIVRGLDGTPIDVKKLRRERDGRDVHLTIDSIIQQEAQRILDETVKRTSAKSATAIVIDPTTGDILVMANSPGVNPGAWASASPDARRNRAITDTYEPGSTFKIVALSAALEEGTVDPNTEFELPPTLKFCDDEDTCIVGESHPRGTEWMSTRQILVESSNIGTIKVAQTLGGTPAERNRKFDEWVHRFGFGHVTGVDFPGETPGIVAPLENWSKVSIGNIPIGQGISVTPIQLISAFAAIANDGVLMKPRLLKRIADEEPVKSESRRVIKAKTARTMRNMFEGVVQDERGTGTAAEIKGYKVGGKTGTAEIADSGGYLKNRYNASFVGFVPANNPRLVTLVVVNDTPMYGGSAAAPAFESITEFALNLLAIPADGRT